MYDSWFECIIYFDWEKWKVRSCGDKCFNVLVVYEGFVILIKCVIDYDWDIVVGFVYWILNGK